MITDKNKSITLISYNHLNLPYKVTFANGGNISFVYDAEGIRLSKKVQPNGGALVTTDYVNIFHYENNALKFFKQPEGFVEYKNNQYIYNYIYKDHLGNNRLVYADLNKDGVINPATEIIEENNYYPFGLKHKGYNELATENPAGHKYKYQEQECNEELGLNWDSFKWRNYDYAIGRFMNIDPLGEKYAYQSHYNFSENRVIDGREIEGLEWENFRTTGKNPGSLKMKLPSSDAQRQHYSVTVKNPNVSYSDFKSSFKEGPQKFLTNSKATFNSPVDGEGNSSDFEKGSFIKIDIKGPMNNAYVKVVGMEDKDDYMSATFATMEGHVEKGKITFRLYDEGDNIRFTINNTSEVDYTLVKDSFAREQQAKSWNEVLSNISKYLGGEEIKKESRIVEPIKEEDK